jgi:hypothetical protein
MDTRVDDLGRLVQGTPNSWTDRARFAEQVRRERFDAIVLGTGPAQRPGGADPQASWARSLGYRTAAESKRFVVLVDERRY